VGTRKFVGSKVVIGNPNSPRVVSFLESDRDNVRISSSNYQTITRATITSSGDATVMTLTDLPSAAGDTKSIEIKSDIISMTLNGVSSTVTPQKITNWDNASSANHIHYYDMPYGGPTTDGNNRQYIMISAYTPLSSKTRVYKNGLRMKINSSATAWDNDYWQNGSSITFSTLVNTGESIVVDFDM
jgi:hypothetical protein